MGISKKDVKIIAVLLSGALLVVLSLTMLATGLPIIMEDLRVSATTVQWLTSGFALTQAIVIPLAAYFMGRFSTRKLFIGALSIFAAGSVIAAVSPNFFILMIGRVIQACATGIIMPTVLSLILLIIPREKRGTGMGLVSLVIGFGPSIGPTIGGLVLDSVGWRVLFLIVAALALVVVLIGATQLVNYKSFKRTKFDPLSVVLSSTGLFCILFGLSTFSSMGNLVITLALVVVGIILVGLFVWRQHKLDEPMLNIGILKTRNYAVNVVVVMLVQAGLVGMSVIMPLFIQGVLGQSATVSGLTLLPGAVIGALSAMIAGRMFDKFGVRPVALTGSLVMVCGIVTLSLLSIDVSIYLVSIAYAIMLLGMQATMTTMNTWGVNSLDNSVIQHATSVSNCLNQVAGSFGTALLVSLTAFSSLFMPDGTAHELSYMGSHISFIGTAVLFGLAFLVIVLMARDKKKDKAVATQKAAAETTVTSEGLSNAVSMLSPSMKVKDVMIADAYSVLQSVTVGEVMTLLLDTNTSGLTVVDDEGSIVAFISDGDIMKYIGESEYTVIDASLMLKRIRNDDVFQDRIKELMNLNVMEIATKRVISVEQDVPLEQACTLLAEKRIKKVPVVLNDKLVGSLSRGDIIRYTMSNLVNELALEAP